MVSGDNSRTLTPRIMKLHRYIDHGWQMTPIDFEVTRSKVKVTVTRSWMQFRTTFADYIMYWCREVYLPGQALSQNFFEQPVFMPPFEEEGVYCFSHVGRSVGRSGWFPDDNSRMLRPRIMKLYRYIDHDWQMNPIDF